MRKKLLLLIIANKTTQILFYKSKYTRRNNDK